MVKYIRESLLKTPGKPNPPTHGVLQEDGLAEVVRPMGLNESLFEPSPRVLEAIVDNLDKIGRYPDAQPPRLSKKISNMFEIEEDLIVWGNGSEELIKGAIDLSVPRGKGLVLPVPTFWGYRSIVAASEAKTKFVNSKERGLVNVQAIIDEIDKDTHAVICVTPNNPSGSCLSGEEIQKLFFSIDIDTLLIVDEAYCEFGQHAGGPDVLACLKKRKGPWVSIRTFSKSYSMAGMRVGYAICSDTMLADALKKTTCVFNLPILGIAAAAAALDDEDHLKMLMEKISKGRKQLDNGLREMSLSPLLSATNFISVELPVDGKKVAQSMLKKGVQIHAWPDPGYENYIRITIGTAADNSFCLNILKEIL